jgi:hypothetical protein
MTLFDEKLHPRVTDGTFTEKAQSLPEVGFAAPAVPVYDPTFFYDRSASEAQLRMVHADEQTQAVQASIRNATQAISDAWLAENDVPHGEAANHSWVDTTVFEDGEFIVADIQHKDPSSAPFGVLVVFDKAGALVGQWDNMTDSFGELWTPSTGLRAQLVADLEQASRDGELGDQLTVDDPSDDGR